MLFSQVKLLFIYRTNGKLLRGDQVCRMKWQGFLSHHKGQWFTVIPHLEDPLHCGCPNPSIPTQCILACVCCVVMGYPCLYMNSVQTEPKQSQPEMEKNSLFITRWICAHISLVHCRSFLLKCSNMESNIKRAAAFKLGWKDRFFPEEGYPVADWVN